MARVTYYLRLRDSLIKTWSPRSAVELSASVPEALSFFFLENRRDIPSCQKSKKKTFRHRTSCSSISNKQILTEKQHHIQIYEILNHHIHPLAESFYFISLRSILQLRQNRKKSSFPSIVFFCSRSFDESFFLFLQKLRVGNLKNEHLTIELGCPLAFACLSAQVEYKITRRETGPISQCFAANYGSLVCMKRKILQMKGDCVGNGRAKGEQHPCRFKSSSVIFDENSSIIDWEKRE